VPAPFDFTQDLAGMPLNHVGFRAGKKQWPLNHIGFGAGHFIDYRLWIINYKVAGRISVIMGRLLCYVKAILKQKVATVPKPQATTTIRTASGQISAVVHLEMSINRTINDIKEPA